MQQFHLFMSIYECCICDITVHYFQVAYVFFPEEVQYDPAVENVPGYQLMTYRLTQHGEYTVNSPDC